jgi:hypothetical protein
MSAACEPANKTNSDSGTGDYDRIVFGHFRLHVSVRVTGCYTHCSLSFVIRAERCCEVFNILDTTEIMRPDAQTPVANATARVGVSVALYNKANVSFVSPSYGVADLRCGRRIYYIGGVCTRRASSFTSGDVASHTGSVRPDWVAGVVGPDRIVDADGMCSMPG